MPQASNTVATLADMKNRVKTKKQNNQNNTGKVVCTDMNVIITNPQRYNINLRTITSAAKIVNIVLKLSKKDRIDQTALKQFIQMGAGLINLDLNRTVAKAACTTADDVVVWMNNSTITTQDILDLKTQVGI